MCCFTYWSLQTMGSGFTSECIAITHTVKSRARVSHRRHLTGTGYNWIPRMTRNGSQYMKKCSENQKQCLKYPKVSYDVLNFQWLVLSFWW